jgi:hypothetical protein
MPSPINLAIGELIEDLNQQLTTALGLGTPFRDEATMPGERFGVIDPQSWQNDPNLFQPFVTLNCNVWVFGAYSSFTETQAGAMAMMADIDHHLLAIGNGDIDRRGILMELIPPQQLTKGLRAPITMPNTQSKHLWIADITGTMTLKLAIDKHVCGHV